MPQGEKKYDQSQETYNETHHYSVSKAMWDCLGAAYAEGIQF